jgi:hypothetical protein
MSRAGNHGTDGAFFIEFIASGRQANHDGMGGAIADTAVASMATG